MVLVGFTHEDTENDATELAEKMLNMKLWHDDKGNQLKKSVIDKGYQILLASNNTLYNAYKKGYTPDLHLAMAADKAKVLY